MQTIERSTDIDAPASTVWTVLTTPDYIGQWADAFMPGANAQSDWTLGGDITWTDDADFAMHGKIVELEPYRILKTAYPPELNPAAPGDKTEFYETYLLDADGDHTRLTVTCGPLNEADYDMIAGPWSEAIETIKDLAERERPGRGAAAHSPEAHRHV